jgi:hypothetical protein
MKHWFSTEKRCYICGKVISANKNPKSIKITLGYSKQELHYFDLGDDTILILEPEFYLCEQHREEFEQHLLSVKIKQYEEKTGKKLNLPINITEDCAVRAYLENGKEVDFFSNSLGIFKEELKIIESKKKKVNPITNAEISYATFLNDQETSKNELEIEIPEGYLEKIENKPEKDEKIDINYNYLSEFNDKCEGCIHYISDSNYCELDSSVSEDSFFTALYNGKDCIYFWDNKPREKTNMRKNKKKKKIKIKKFYCINCDKNIIPIKDGIITKCPHCEMWEFLDKKKERKKNNNTKQRKP